MNDRTYLPVRAIADLVGLDVGFDGATNTVLLTTSSAPVVQQPAPAAGVSLLEVAPWFETFHMQVMRSVTMRGTEFSNVIAAGVVSTANARWSHHALDGQFTTLTGIVGRIDGHGEVPRTIRFLGDGVELASFGINTDTAPTTISIDVTGVNTLRIEVTPPMGGSGVGVAFADAMLQ